MKSTPTLKMPRTIAYILPIYSFGGSFDSFPRCSADFGGLGHEIFKN
jgi:hypothetical protein